MVEIRKLSEKISFIQVKHDILSAREEEKYLKSADARYALRDSQRLGVSVTYRKFVYESALNDSALGRYLGILFFREMGRYDSARVDFELMEQLFFNAERLYNHPIPSTVREELNVSPNEARLNVVGFSGLNPILDKERKYHRNSRLIKYNAPVLVTRPSIVSRVEIEFNDGRIFELELLENLGRKQSELMKRFEEQDRRLSRKYGPIATGVKTFFFISPYFIMMAPFVSFFTRNSVDTRAPRYFPDRVYAGGLSLPPGTYSFSVKYYDTSGGLIDAVPYDNMRIDAGRLNLVEAYCLQ